MLQEIRTMNNSFQISDSDYVYFVFPLVKHSHLLISRFRLSRAIDYIQLGYIPSWLNRDKFMLLYVINP
jgi:hypothetical protein